MYQAVTGHAPESSMQRTFLDELKSISDYGVKIKKEYESIILKGLSLSANKRYQSTDEMSKAILEVLPEITIIQVYSPPDFSEEMTKGEWSNFITDIKTRLDSLGNIYS